MKRRESLKKLEDSAEGALRAMLCSVPNIAVDQVALYALMDDVIALRASLVVSGRPHELVCALEPTGQPRHVHMAVLRLRDSMGVGAADRSAVIIAPYLSADARALCTKYAINFLDLEGNCRLTMGTIFIERLVATQPVRARRALRSIFKPVSAQVLRLMLGAPRRPWRVMEVAEAAEVSVGQVSNVRRALLDRAWAEVVAEGLVLTRPDALLDAWRDEYEPPVGRRLEFYTTLHGGALEAATRSALAEANEHGAAMLASFSAAHWLAPYARTGTQFFYADEAGLEVLRRALKLSSSAMGANIIITCLPGHGLFLDAVEGAPGVRCTSPVQTYLDLTAAGDRGREAAEHLRRERLKWQP